MSKGFNVLATVLVAVGAAVTGCDAYKKIRAQYKALCANGKVPQFLNGEASVFEPAQILNGEPSVFEPVQNFSEAEMGVGHQRAWCKENGMICFSVTSDGTTGEQWIKRLRRKGFHVHDNAEHLLRSKSFKPTNGVTTKVVLRIGAFQPCDDNTTSYGHINYDEMCAAAFYKAGLKGLNAEIACLIREKFTSKDIKEMGLANIAVMHNPIESKSSTPLVLEVCGDYYGGYNSLSTEYIQPMYGWPRTCGLAFAK